MTQADSIREYALKHYVKPARRAGRSTIMIRAGDVSKGMGLLPPGRLPKVCQTLRGKIFLDQAELELQNHTGPKESTTTTFYYATRGRKQ